MAQPLTWAAKTTGNGCWTVEKFLADIGAAPWEQALAMEFDIAPSYGVSWSISKHR